MKSVWSYLSIKFVPHSKHSVSAIKTNYLMLYTHNFAICSEIWKKKHIIAHCGNNVKFLYVKPGGVGQAAQSVERLATG
jgi:hypothetical protein